MYTINVRNLITNKVWGQGTFYNGEDLNTFRLQEQEGVFGKPDRWVRDDHREPYELALTPIETMNIEGHTVYHYAADYIFTTALTSTDKNADIALGIRYRKCCEEIHDYITGYNSFRNISITDFQANFNSQFQLLLANRAIALKAAVEITPVDGVWVTQELKDTIINIFIKYGI